MSEISVLVVEDEAVTARAYGEYIDTLAGFRTVAACGSIETALALLGEHDPDVILLDLSLPDAIEVSGLRRLRAQGITTDVIVVSSARASQIVYDALALGAVGYLLKPFTTAALRDRLLEYRRQRVEPGSSELDQRQVDRILRERTVSVHAAKGIDEATLTTVVRVLTDAVAPATASEVGEQCALSQVTARRYLDYLVRMGDAEAALDYSTRGRPATRYRSVSGAAEGSDDS